MIIVSAKKIKKCNEKHGKGLTEIGKFCKINNERERRGNEI